MSTPDFRTDLDKQFIDGAWRDGHHDKRLTDANPFDGSTVADFGMASVEDVDHAYTAAKTAQVIAVKKVNAIPALRAQPVRSGDFIAVSVACDLAASAAMVRRGGVVARQAS